MKRILINIGCFAGGVVVGGLITYKFLQSKFEDALQDELDAICEEKHSEELGDDALIDNQITFFDENVDESDSYNLVTVYFEDGEEVDQEEEEVIIEPDPEPEKKINRKKEPYIISGDEFRDEMPHFSKISLAYYTGDEVFVDEQEDVIDDIRYLVGDAYEYFGCDTENEDVVYVRNYKQSTDFELTRIHDLFSETVAGSYRSDFYDDWEDDDEYV